jgi:hypothetical protein
VSFTAISGLLGLNLWLLFVGVAVLFAIRGWTSWGELLRLLGLGYMAGVATMGIAWVWQLTAGIDLSVSSIFVVGLLVAVVGALLGLRLGHTLPPRPAAVRLPLSTTSALGAALLVVYLEAQFRAGRLAGLYEFDAWSFWIPKARAIYEFGGLDAQFFHDLPGQSYPPLVPALEAAAFHFMGSPDVVTLHLQFWFLLLGFVGALIGVLAPRVPAHILWPPVLLVLVTPNVVGRALQPQADFLLDELFALGVVLLALWLTSRRDSFLGLTTLLFAAAFVTKREGIVLVACAVIAALVVTWRDARDAWPRLALLGIVSATVLVPWGILLAVRHYSGGGPEAGGVGLLSNIDRAWPSLRLAVSTLFDFDIWLIVVPLLLLAIVVAAAAGDAQLAAYAGALTLLSVAALTWSTWAFPSLPITKTPALNPIVRFSGALGLAAAGLVPLLLTRASEATWRRP